MTGFCKDKIKKINSINQTKAKGIIIIKSLVESLVKNLVVVGTILCSMTSIAVLTPSNSTIYNSALAVNKLTSEQLPTQIQQYYVVPSSLIANSPSNSATNANSQLNLTMNEIQNIAYWQDNNGENYLVNLKRPIDNRNANSELNEIISHLYTVNGQDIKRQWQIYDYYDPCGEDVISEYTEQSPIVTDINHNGVAEVAVAYYQGCRGDVGYDDMKIIVHEGRQKFAARGHSAICNLQTGLPVSNNTDHYGGDYVIDSTLLSNAALSINESAQFKSHFDNLWQQNQCSIYFDYSMFE